MTRFLPRILLIVLLALLGTSAARAELPPERPGKRDVYFVGFAAFGAQDVFLSEARGAAAVVGKAYDSPGRAILLSNQPGSGLAPATPATLTAALAEVAKKMNPAEDVAFILLTSHGNESGIVLAQGDRMLGMMSPGQLGGILSKSGIRNAVVVVSACHSGVFKPIATQDRLVITAARSDRPSFGCKQGARWTYFGQAFFRDALARNKAPDKAFAQARASVSKREKSEGFQPSEPQIAGGNAVVKLLATAPKGKK